MSVAEPSRAVTPGKAVLFAQEDLARVFDAKTIQQARHLMLAGAVRSHKACKPQELQDAMEKIAA